MKAHSHQIIIKSSDVPTVELDSSAHAAYVRFKRTKVTRTVEVEGDDAVVITMDFDAKDEVIGIEFVGVSEFGIRALLKMVPVKAPNIDTQNVRYVPSNLVAA